MRLAALGLMAVAGCAEPPSQDIGAEAVFRPEYRGIQTALLTGDLVRFDVAMSGARDGQDLRDYADCAAAQYALIRGYGFARHIRTQMDDPSGERGGIWRADAVYTVSPDLPSGRKTIDAISQVRDCRQRGIPTV